MTERELPWDPRLSSWLDAVEERWVSTGLSPLTCGELRARLVDDLMTALMAGAPVNELITGDPERFADDVATASGYGPIQAPIPVAADATVLTMRIPKPLAALPPRLRFVATAVGGALVGAALGWYTVLPIGYAILDAIFPTGAGTGAFLGAIAFWVIYAGFVALVASLAVGLQFDSSALRRRLSRSTALALLSSGALITLPTVAFARSTGYSTTSGVVLTEVVLVVVALIVGLVAAGELAWRRAADLR